MKAASYMAGAVACCLMMATLIFVISPWQMLFLPLEFVFLFMYVREKRRCSR